MLNSDIIYLKKYYDQILINYINNVEYVVNKKIDDLFDEMLLHHLTTYKGRIEATKKIYHISKNIPIYIDYNLVFIQIFNKKQYNNIYINICRIIDMIKDGEDTIIVFDDGSTIRIAKPYHLLEKYYNNSLKINLIKFRKD